MSPKSVSLMDYRIIVKQSILFFILIAASFLGNAQIIYSTPDPMEADLYIYLVENAEDADVIVYLTDDPEAVSSEGVWYLTKNPYVADKHIYFTKEEDHAELKVLFSSLPNIHGWVTEDLKFWME